VDRRPLDGGRGRGESVLSATSSVVGIPAKDVVDLVASGFDFTSGGNTVVVVVTKKSDVARGQRRVVAKDSDDFHTNDQAHIFNLVDRVPPANRTGHRAGHIVMVCCRSRHEPVTGEVIGSKCAGKLH
jgi:hypothetical protein